MTTTLTAEKLAQRAVDVNVLTEQDLNGVWAEFGTRAVDYEPFKQALVRRGLLTNYQLDRLIEGVERDLGARLAELSREDKQRAIRMLDERGAFILRRAVEDVADVMGVSRITVYNYLNAIHR